MAGVQSFFEGQLGRVHARKGHTAMRSASFGSSAMLRVKAYAQHCRDFGDDVVQAGKRICLRRLLSNISAGANRRSTLTCRAILPAM